jgi:hypothetical protein
MHAHNERCCRCDVYDGPVAATPARNGHCGVRRERGGRRTRAPAGGGACCGLSGGLTGAPGPQTPRMDAAGTASAPCAPGLRQYSSGAPGRPPRAAPHQQARCRSPPPAARRAHACLPVAAPRTRRQAPHAAAPATAADLRLPPAPAPQLVAKWVEGMLPFLALLALAFAYQFCTSIFLCVWLGCSVHKANEVIRKIVAQTACEPSELAAAVIFVAANVALTLFFAGAPQLRALLLLPFPAQPPPLPGPAGAAPDAGALGFWQVLFRVAITDSLVRCCGVIPKLLIAAATMLPRAAGGPARRISGDGGGRRVSADGGGRRVSGSGEAPAAEAPASPAGSSGSRGMPGGGGSGGPRSPCSCGPSGSAGLVSSMSCCLGTRPCLAAAGAPSSSGGLAVRRSIDLGALASASAPPQSPPPAGPGPARRTRSSLPSFGGPAPPAPAPGAAAAAFAVAPPRPHLRPLALPQGHGSAESYAAVCARRRARLLALYESIQATYRALLPAPLWYSFFLRTAPNLLFGTLLAASYLTFKGYALARRGRLLLLATRIVLRTGALYGRYLTKAEVAAGGADLSCPICMHACAAPIRLDCSHVYCEDCLAEWLEREPTCPLVGALAG